MNPDDALWRQALDHVLALHAASTDDERHRAVAIWRRADPAHEAAFQEADKVWRLAGRAQPARAASWTKMPVVPSRRRMLVGGAALAAAFAGILFMTPLGHRLRGAETSGAGETRVIALPDGSRMTLGPGSVAAIDYAGPIRAIDLIAGIAFFDVVANAARPFAVRAGDVVITVVGAAFEVRRIASKIAIAVAQGVVDVKHSVTTALRRDELHAGDWMIIDTETHSVESGHGEAGAVATWRAGILVVEDRSIREVVEEVGRWYAGAIVIIDENLARRRVSGTLDLRDPEAALKAVLALYGGRVDKITPWALVLSADG